MDLATGREFPFTNPQDDRHLYPEPPPGFHYKWDGALIGTPTRRRPTQHERRTTPPPALSRELHPFQPPLVQAPTLLPPTRGFEPPPLNPSRSAARFEPPTPFCQLPTGTRFGYTPPPASAEKRPRNESAPTECVGCTCGQHYLVLKSACK